MCQNQGRITECLSMGTSGVYMQSCAAYKIKPKCLVNYIVNDLGYLYLHFQSCCIFVTRKKTNAYSLVQIEIKNY